MTDVPPVFSQIIYSFAWIVKVNKGRVFVASTDFLLDGRHVVKFISSAQCKDDEASDKTDLRHEHADTPKLKSPCSRCFVQNSLFERPC